MPQRLCVGTKTLPNGKQIKVYEKKGITPYNRLLNNEKVTAEVKEKLKAEHEKLNPKFLHQELMKEKCAILKASRTQTEQS